jgi:hypothetical protein
LKAGTEAREKVASLTAEVESLQQQNSTLAAQVAALKKNISCLYKTAKAEIDRKSETIKELRIELDLLTERTKQS